MCAHISKDMVCVDLFEFLGIKVSGTGSNEIRIANVKALSLHNLAYVGIKSHKA